LKSFFVNINLNKKAIKNIISISTKIEKIHETACHIKLLISAKLIHNDAKNLTSSTVLAFITTNHKNDHQIINAINDIIHKKPSIVFVLVVDFCFFIKCF
jgi:hypothetical protein